MIKRIIPIAALAATVLFTTLATAGEAKPFNPEAFAKAQAEGKIILVDFHAGWCPVCKKQAEVMPQVLKQEKFQQVVVFNADYDSEKNLKKQLKINHQSTLVVFKGEKEVGREQGITTATAIGELLQKGL